MYNICRKIYITTPDWNVNSLSLIPFVSRSFFLNVNSKYLRHPPIRAFINCILTLANCVLNHNGYTKTYFWRPFSDYNRTHNNYYWRRNIDFINYTSKNMRISLKFHIRNIDKSWKYLTIMRLPMCTYDATLFVIYHLQ